MQGKKKIPYSNLQALHYMTVSTALERWRMNFRLTVVLNVSASPTEASGEKPRISLYLLRLDLKVHFSCKMTVLLI